MTKIRNGVILIFTGLLALIIIIVFNGGNDAMSSFFKPKPKIDAAPMQDEDTIHYILSGEWMGDVQHPIVIWTVAGLHHHDDKPKSPWERELDVERGTYLAITISRSGGAGPIVCGIWRESVLVVGPKTTVGDLVTCSTVAQ